MSDVSAFLSVQLRWSTILTQVQTLPVYVSNFRNWHGRSWVLPILFFSSIFSPSSLSISLSLILFSLCRSLPLSLSLSLYVSSLFLLYGNQTSLPDSQRRLTTVPASAKGVFIDLAKHAMRQSQRRELLPSALQVLSQLCVLSHHVRQTRPVYVAARRMVLTFPITFVLLNTSSIKREPK